MKQELQNILTELIAFYPVTSNQENVKDLLMFANSRLKKFGITNGQLLENNGAHMLVASTQPTKHSKILLQAHVDVVPAKRELREASDAGDGNIKGRGARDMLFATAGYLWLINDLREQLPKLDLSIMLTGDEEVGGVNTIPFLLKQGYGADVVWLPDAGNNLQELVVRAKGVFNFVFTTHGKPHHGSRPWEGDNAALKLVLALHELQAAFRDNSREQSTCSITKLEAGDSVNKGPGSARAQIDIRFDNQRSLITIKELLRIICSRYDADLSNITHGESYTNDHTSPFIQSYVTINQKITGKDVRLISTNGSSDARYFSAKNIPVIMTRPESGGSHSDDEWVNMDSLVKYCLVMREFVKKVATKDK